MANFHLIMKIDYIYCKFQSTKYTKIYENTRKYTKIHEKYMKIYENTQKYTKIHENIRKQKDEN